mmetsp:Transcript_6446/g.13424  ORF Transcript_6446/g.13424 Transcript_6446/m.13424 type:complete len:242 (+) Transcript_6446:958-1683(+)
MVMISWEPFPVISCKIPMSRANLSPSASRITNCLERSQVNCLDLRSSNLTYGATKSLALQTSCAGRRSGMVVRLGCSDVMPLLVQRAPSPQLAAGRQMRRSAWSVLMERMMPSTWDPQAAFRWLFPLVPSLLHLATLLDQGSQLLQRFSFFLWPLLFLGRLVLLSAEHTSSMGGTLRLCLDLMGLHPLKKILKKQRRKSVSCRHEICEKKADQSPNFVLCQDLPSVSAWSVSFETETVRVF